MTSLDSPNVYTVEGVPTPNSLDTVSSFGIPISERLTPVNTTTSFRAYVASLLDRLRVLLRQLYNTTPDRVSSIRYTRRIDGRNFNYRIVFRDVTNQSQNVSKNFMSVEEKELLLIYNKLLVPESEEWIRTIGRLTTGRVTSNLANPATGELVTSIEEANLQDILFLQYGYDLAIGNVSTFLPWRVVRQIITFRKLPETRLFVIPGTEGLSFDWITDTLELEYGAYQNMSLPFVGNNVIVYSSRIVRPTDPSRNAFVNLLTRAVNAYSGGVGQSIQQFQYRLGLQYDYLLNPDQVLEGQLLAAAVNPTLKVIPINARQASNMLAESERLRQESANISMELETNPVDLLRRELEDTIRRTTLTLENEQQLLEEAQAELDGLNNQGGPEQWEPEQQNRAIKLRGDIRLLTNSIQVGQVLIDEKNQLISQIRSVSASVLDNIRSREQARQVVDKVVERNQNSTVNVDRRPIYIDEGFGEVLQGANALNIDDTEYPQALEIGIAAGGQMIEF